MRRERERVPPPRAPVGWVTGDSGLPKGPASRHRGSFRRLGLLCWLLPPRRAWRVQGFTVWPVDHVADLEVDERVANVGGELPKNLVHLVNDRLSDLDRILGRRDRRRKGRVNRLHYRSGRFHLREHALVVLLGFGQQSTSVFHVRVSLKIR